MWSLRVSLIAHPQFLYKSQTHILWVTECWLFCLPASSTPRFSAPCAHAHLDCQVAKQEEQKSLAQNLFSKWSIIFNSLKDVFFHCSLMTKSILHGPAVHIRESVSTDIGKWWKASRLTQFGIGDKILHLLTPSHPGREYPFLWDTHAVKFPPH